MDAEIIDMVTSPAERVPFDIQHALRFYNEEGAGVGHFLMAMLDGDLYEAIARADLKNRALIPDIALYIRETLPKEAYGSKAKVNAWLARFDDQGEAQVA